MQRLVRPRGGFAGAVRGALRRQPAFVRLVEARRAARDERAYLALRARYARPTESLDMADGTDALLRAVWPGPARTRSDPSTVRLFIVTGETDTTGAMKDELCRSFDARSFDFVPWLPRSATRDLSWRAPLQEAILREFRDAHVERPIDLVLVYGTHFEIEPATLRAMRASGAAVALLCGDDKHSFEADPRHPSGQRPLIGSATVHLTNSRECVGWYEAEGAACLYVGWAADPAIYRPLGLPRDLPVSFVGGWYGARRDLIARVRAAGIPVRCWGPASEGGPLSRDDVVRVYNRSVVNLGFGGVGSSARITCVKARDFEVPLTGSLYLTQYDPDLATHYEIGREILCYRDALDLVEQLRYWLARPSEAAAIGRAARERALREHTWTARLTTVLQRLGILR